MYPIESLTRIARSAGAVAIVTVALTGCSTAGEQRHEDRRQCADYGEGYGARHHGDCMDRQQYRRDREQLMNQEKALINAEQARENLRMLREIRRRRGE